MTNPITITDAVALLEALRSSKSGHCFTVVFVKRTTGEERTMNARFGVQKHLKGGVLAYNPGEKNLMGCYDMQKPEGKGYRMINLDALKRLTIDGQTYEVAS